MKLHIAGISAITNYNKHVSTHVGMYYICTYIHADGEVYLSFGNTNVAICTYSKNAIYVINMLYLIKPINASPLSYLYSNTENAFTYIHTYVYSEKVDILHLHYRHMDMFVYIRMYVCNNRFRSCP